MAFPLLLKSVQSSARSQVPDPSAAAPVTCFHLQTAENFLWLCKGGMSRVVVDPSNADHPCSLAPLSLKGTPFHRAKEGIGVQGGDIINKDGTGGRGGKGGMGGIEIRKGNGEGAEGRKRVFPGKVVGGGVM